MFCDKCGKEIKKNQSVTQPTTPVQYWCYSCAGVDKRYYQNKMMKTKSIRKK